MEKRLNRYSPNWKKIYFIRKKKIFTKNFRAFVKKYEVHGLILVLRPDFKLIKKKINRYTHFNIQFTGHKPGKKYLVTEIHKRGFFNGKTMKQPILKTNFILTKCLSVQNDIDYANLRPKFFKHSLNNIKNVNTLKKTMTRRYKTSLAHVPDKKKLSLGVAITDLKIIKKFQI